MFTADVSLIPNALSFLKRNLSPKTEPTQDKIYSSDRTTGADRPQVTPVALFSLGVSVQGGSREFHNCMRRCL